MLKQTGCMLFTLLSLVACNPDSGGGVERLASTDIEDVEVVNDQDPGTSFVTDCPENNACLWEGEHYIGVRRLLYPSDADTGWHTLESARKSAKNRFHNKVVL